MRAFVLGVVAVAVASLCGCQAQTCSADLPCATGEVCLEGVCQNDPSDAGGSGNECGGPSGSAPNLLTNAGFECGTTGWGEYPTGVVTLSTTTTNPKSGSKALVITAQRTSAKLNVLSNTVTVTGPTTICARAWMRGTAGDGHMAVNHAPEEGGLGSEETASSPIQENEWASVLPDTEIRSTISGTEKVTLKLQLWSPQIGQTLIVDDVQMWESKDGHCDERH